MTEESRERLPSLQVLILQDRDLNTELPELETGLDVICLVLMKFSLANSHVFENVAQLKYLRTTITNQT
jgi:hypothetical protein